MSSTIKSEWVYIVMADGVERDTWQASLVDSCRVCPNYKIAYKLGRFLSGMTGPTKSYRVSLELCKAHGAVQIDGAPGVSFTIVRTTFVRY